MLEHGSSSEHPDVGVGEGVVGSLADCELAVCHGEQGELCSGMGADQIARVVGKRSRQDEVEAEHQDGDSEPDGRDDDKQEAMPDAESAHSIR